ncbi:hypothetical protein DASB73_034890 [Starmerella bacillaris]|uniref:BAG domain-containing protein n=1 Tax=Starmerella bacillaris TaxID=1247836 RepID=A0AAV5RPC3_STABA|nr:hypothetical protein DASB73_034890 [Starmerella bacillaris]
MGNLFSNLWKSGKIEYVRVQYENQTSKITFSGNDYTKDKHVLVKTLQQRAAHALNIPVEELVLSVQNSHRKLTDASKSLESYGVGPKTEIVATRAQAAPKIKIPTPAAKDEISKILQEVESELGGRIKEFITNPPKDAEERDNEHRILSEVILAKTIALDNVQISNDDERLARKKAIASLQKYHHEVDKTLNDMKVAQHAEEAEKSRHEVLDDVSKKEEPETTEAAVAETEAKIEETEETKQTEETEETKQTEEPKEVEQPEEVEQTEEPKDSEPVKESTEAVVAETKAKEVETAQATEEVKIEESTEAKVAETDAQIKETEAKVAETNEETTEAKEAETEARIEETAEEPEVAKETAEETAEVTKEETKEEPKEVSAEPTESTEPTEPTETKEESPVEQKSEEPAKSKKNRSRTRTKNKKGKKKN